MQHWGLYSLSSIDMALHILILAAEKFTSRLLICICVYKACFVVSGTCHAQCLRNAEKPVDRWSHVGCSVCCMHDKDGDGFLTEKDVDLTYEMFCGEDGNEQESKCQCSDQRERLITMV